MSGSGSWDGRSRRGSAATTMLALAGLALALAIPATAGAGVKADFNGDGRDDLAIGSTEESVDGVLSAGTVTVLYGETPGGVGTAKTQLWHQNRSGVPGDATRNNGFGSVLAAGNLNADDYDDLAIGVPNHTVGGLAGAGAVIVLYGSASGLTATGAQMWHRDKAGVGEEPGDHEALGAALAIGDFGGDGAADLAIGVPRDDVQGVAFAGSINVLFGADSTGLSAEGDEVWHRGKEGIQGPLQAETFFGWSLAAGNFDGDETDDLAVGVIGDDVGNHFRSGSVTVLYGTPTGFTGVDQLWSLNTDGVQQAAAAGDRFGSRLAAGDFDADGEDDLAVAAPQAGDVDHGRVHVLYGSAEQITATGDDFFDQANPDLGATAESRDNFGDALAVGDFESDGAEDLVIGVPYENLGGSSDAGLIHVLYGVDGSGLTAVGSDRFSQDPLEGAIESDDVFGRSLAVGDFDNENGDDLAVGAPGEDIGDLTAAGAVNVVYSNADALTATGDEVFSQNTQGVPNACEVFDRFGNSLAVSFE